MKCSKAFLAALGCTILFLLSAGCGKQDTNSSMPESQAEEESIDAAEQSRLEALHQQEIADLLDTDRIYNGITIEGVSVGGMTQEEAIAALTDVEKSIRDHISIHVLGVGFERTYTANDVPYSYNTAEVVEQAYNIGRNIADREEAFQRVTNLQQQPIELRLYAELQWETAVEDIYNNIMENAQWEPRSNQITSFTPDETGSYYFEISPGLNGITLDSEWLHDHLYALFLNGQYVDDISLFEIEQEIPFTPVDYSGVQLQSLSSYSTTSTNNANGNSNMALALSLCNGFVIQPGETFRFNDVVGDSTTEAGGWKQAGAISNGVSSTAYGGGICQASTTIYGAALRAGLTITKRSNHSIPSTYVPIGQDAAINYGSDVQDLWIQNDYSTPVFLSCGMSGVTLSAAFLCIERPEDWDTIEVNSWTTSTLPAKSGVEYVPNDGKHTSGTVAAAARKGYTASSVRIFYKNGQEVKRENISDSLYPATAQKVYR